MPQVVETDRERAKREAKDCLQAVRQEGFQLDGFNLLGVVANPRAGMTGSSRQNHTPSGTASANSPTRPGSDPSRHSTINNSSNNATDDPSSDVFAGAVHSLEFTLGQVTEQIESLNFFLEELSRQYLGDDAGEAHFLEYYYQDEGDTREEPPVPSHLANLQIAELQTYLEQCGELAHSLFTQGLETSSLPPPTSPMAAAATATMTVSVADDWNEVPSLFFDDKFDLTHSDTFVQLLLLQEQTRLSSTNTTTTLASQNSLYQPTGELIPARDQDDLAGHLDRVELALQEQVRLKAGMFFQETTRFRQLQSSIEELLEQVQTLRQDIRAVLSVYRQTKEISNHQRQDYELLVQLIDAANNLIQTKSSIGGLLSANDQLGAAQQIQYGRRLLRQGIAMVLDDPTTTTTTTTDLSASNSNYEPLMQLQNMIALASCEAQFQQYESLVVQSLSEEMVDTFFNWKPTDNKGRVHEMLQALNLCHALNKTGDLYNRRLQQTIRMTVRTTIAEFVESSGTAAGSGVTGMSYQDFFSCMELLMEELQSVLHMARQVDQFAQTDAIFPQPDKRWTNDALVVGADLATKSIAELLRLRKEAHSLITLDEMRQLWDTCLKFTTTIEEYGNNIKAVGLRSTLVGQAKAFLDRTHESNMSALVAALDSERWMPCEVSSERQAALTRLCTGRVLVTAVVKKSPEDITSELNNQKKPTAEVEGVQYKVVWSSLLLVEMIMTNLLAAGHFQSLATNAITKVAELLRLFNTRTTNLVLGAGAIHSAARLKSINAKHLSMVTQCLGMMTALLPHIRAALMSQLPPKQHALLNDLDKIKKDYMDHNEKVLNKFVTIIGGIVEHGLAPRIAHTDFDARAKEFSSETKEITCCVFLEGICSNARKMHQVLSSMLPPDHLQDVFSRIFAYVDQKVPTLIIAAAAAGSSSTSTPNGNATFRLPTTNDGKRRLIIEVKWMTVDLNSLEGVLPWDFTCTNFLERKLDVEWPNESVQEQHEEPVDPSDDATDKEPNEVLLSPEETESSVSVTNGASVNTPTVENGKTSDQPSDDST